MGFIPMTACLEDEKSKGGPATGRPFALARTNLGSSNK